MARTIPVTAEGKLVYQIELTSQFEGLAEELSSFGFSKEQKICIVTDSNAEQLYGKKVMEHLKTCFSNVILHSFAAGENNKNLDTVQNLYETLIRNHFDRNDLLIALGGGVVGDLTGFTAATYLRGIAFVQVPTTLLSQVDSSIGGKTGVDFLQYKNMVGAFYQPRLVYMNLNALTTLPKQQLHSGMGEIIKHGLIKDRAYYMWLKEHAAEILDLQPDVLEEMIYISCNIKRDVVERDPKEQGERALLNFGHTIGHAIEKLSNFRLYHGECVGLGMIAASYISMRLGNISAEEFSDIENCIKTFGLPVKANGFSPKEVLKATKSDKKMAGSQVKFILLASLGNAYIYKELTDTQILDGICYVCGY